MLYILRKKRKTAGHESRKKERSKKKEVCALLAPVSAPREDVLKAGKAEGSTHATQILVLLAWKILERNSRSSTLFLVFCANV